MDERMTRSRTVGYADPVEPRTGRVVDGAIVLDDAEGLVEGAAITVWIAEAESSFIETDEELAEIDLGLAALEGAELVDARSFLAELRREE
jgi:hypothetical protein